MSEQSKTPRTDAFASSCITNQLLIYKKKYSPPEKADLHEIEFVLALEHARQLETELADARAALREMSKDAERYRCLRANRDSKKVSVVFKIGDGKFDYAIAQHDHTFDQFIDAEVLAKQG